MGRTKPFNILPSPPLWSETLTSLVHTHNHGLPPSPHPGLMQVSEPDMLGPKAQVQLSSIIWVVYVEYDDGVSTNCGNSQMVLCAADTAWRGARPCSLPLCTPNSAAHTSSRVSSSLSLKPPYDCCYLHHCSPSCSPGLHHPAAQVYTMQFCFQLGQIPAGHFPKPQAAFSLPQIHSSLQGSTHLEKLALFPIPQV